MLANFEKRAYNGTERVWTGRYRNLHNLPHWHLENELICVEQGQATVSHNHQEYLLTEGDAIFLGSGEIHYIKSDPDSITAITLFDAAQPEHSSISNYKNLLAEIEKDYCYITFSDAASFMGLSEPYFSRFFRKISGMTFSRYLNTVRLEHAIAMLQDPTQKLSVTEVASRCGFDTIRHFNRVFRDITGMTPRELPQNYVPDFKPICRIEDAFNPTLQSSELLTQPLE